MSRSSNRLRSLGRNFEPPPEEGWDMDAGKFNMGKMRSRFIKGKENTFQREIIRDLEKIKVVQPNGEMSDKGGITTALCDELAPR